MKKKYYLILDTETATLPFANEYAKNEKQKRDIAIAKPLVYDIGWVIIDRDGNELVRKNFLVQETFFVPQIFNTAYYREKRPMYMELLSKGELTCKLWNEIIKILLEDLLQVDFVCAYNAAFDFKKAIPFTEKYITALYSSHYQRWENFQRAKCRDIVMGCNNSKNEEYLNPVFTLRNFEFPIVDLWGLACERLINNQRYKNFCLKNNMITDSGTFFKTSAETTFSYLIKDSEYKEEHTALEDSLIEAQILVKALKRGKIEPTLGAFPFRELGNTYDYVREKKNVKYIPVVLDKLYEHIDGKKESGYRTRLENIIDKLELLYEEVMG